MKQVDVSVPPWRAPGSDKAPGVADTVEMVDRIHLSLGTEGSPLADSFEQLVVSRLTNKYNPLCFASEYAETVPTKIIDDTAAHEPRLVSFGD